MRYRVTYEVRQIGAIGTWSRKSDEVEASGPTEAFDAFRAKYSDRYEFRFPYACDRIED